MDTNVVYGGTATFNVTAVGTALSYQWYKAGSLPILDQSLAGQTGTNLVLNNVGDPEAGKYYVAVKNASGTVTSRQAVFTVVTNSPPVAGNDNYLTRENVPLIVPAPGVLLNDSDVNGQALTALLMTNVTQGSLSLNTNGAFSYTPPSNFFGNVSFTYRASDGTLSVVEQNSSGGSAIEIDDGEAGAQSFRHGTAGGASYMIRKVVIYLSREKKTGSSLNFSIGTGINSGALAGSAVAIPCSSITDTSSGASFQTFEINYSSPVGPFTAGTTYYLNLDNQTGRKAYLQYYYGNSYANGTLYYNGGNQNVDVSFQIYDTTTSNPATVTISVNDPPIAVNDTTNTPEDKSVTVNVLANDSDPEGAALTVTGTSTTNGTAVISGNKVVFTPSTNFNGTTAFNYTISDGSLFATGLVTVAVSPVNDPPVSFNQSYTNLEDVVLTIPAPGVLANAVDVDGDALTAQLVSNVTHGSLLLNPNGGFSYLAATNYNGSDSFTYRANDGTTNGNVATVTLNITAVNDLPVASDDAYTTLEDVPLIVPAMGVLTNDYDVDGNAIKALLLSSVAHGSLSLNTNGGFTYTPATNYNGSDSFTYRDSDGFSTGNVATVTITVSAVNDGSAIANNDVYTTQEDVALNVSVPGVLGNDTDVDGDALTATLISNVAHGDLNLNPNGSFTYTPDTNYNGSDAFTYSVSDGFNPAPTVLQQNATGGYKIEVIKGTGGSQSFRQGTAGDPDYTISKIVLYVSREPALPTTDPGFSIGTNINVGPVAGSSVTISAASISNTTSGSSFQTYVINYATPVGPFTAGATYFLNLTNGTNKRLFVEYANANTYPNGTYYANTTNQNKDIRFQVLGYSDVATVTINITSVNDAPVSGNDNYTTLEDTVLTVPAGGILVNDTDAEGDPLTVQLVSNVTRGILNLNTNGGFTYKPNTNFNGVDSFTYRANDGTTNGNLATVTINITPVYDLPVAVDDLTNTLEDTSVMIDVLANDYNPDNRTLTLLNTATTNGTAIISGTNIVFMPATNFNGTTTFTYTFSDGSNDVTGTVTVAVASVTDVPIVSDAAYITSENIQLIVPPSGILSNAVNVENAPLSASLVATASHGIVNLNTNGSFTYKPASNYFGSDSFTYRASVLSMSSAVATVSLTVRDTRTPLSFVATEMTAGGFTLHLSEPGGFECVIEASTNMMDWTPIFTNAGAGVVIDFTDDSATNAPARFYRALAR